MLLDEPGGEKVKAVLDGALLCALNLAEIIVPAGFPHQPTLPQTGIAVICNRTCAAAAADEFVRLSNFQASGEPADATCISPSQHES
jgi:PIN domain nuclease of toxin-antitoxin system